MQQKWRTVRPWLPPSSTSSPPEAGSSALRLEVLDVTSTAVALSVLTPPSSSPARPQISIQLDRRPWPHVAHAGSESGVETTVIVYGLEPGVEYEISLEVVRAEEERESTVVEIETAAAAAEPPATVTEPSTPTPDAEAPALPDGPPPPYSPALPPAPDEAQLRALLKKLRTSSKRTETVLNSSISALKKSVEKGQKEDQRARSRIVAIEEAIRKARDAEAEMRGAERQRCEDRVHELEREEIEVAEELKRRKAGGQLTPVKVAPPTPPTQEDEQEEEGHEVGLADLAKELDALNRRIDEAESDRRAKAADTLRLLELELGQIENDLNQLDRDEAHRYNIAARLSSDSLDYLPAPPSSSFLSKWNRTSAPSDPRSFGRFFRRTPSSPIPAPLPEAHTSPDGQFHAQSFAQAQQAIWAAPLSGFASTLRRRSGSLNSTARAFGTEDPFPRVSSLPSVNGDADEARKEGGGWGRAWSQVVVRSGRNGSQASIVTPEEVREVV